MNPGVAAETRQTEDHYERHARDLQPLQHGQQARIQDHQIGKCVPATVTQKSDELRSYIVTTSTGQRLRRHRIHIRDIPPVPAEDTHPEPAQAATTSSDSNPECQPNHQRDSKESTNCSNYLPPVRREMWNDFETLVMLRARPAVPVQLAFRRVLCALNLNIKYQIKVSYRCNVLCYFCVLVTNNVITQSS